MNDARFDLYVWHAPRDLEAESAARLVDEWHAAGGDPANSPFEPSTDVGWFHRELRNDDPDLELVSDATPSQSRRPVWLSTENEPPARVVAVRFGPATPPETLESILGLATKYDLVLFDPRRGRVVQPLEQMSAYASATFWPAGAIRSIVAGAIGLAVAVGAWVVGIPLLSGLLVLIGGFMAVLAVVTIAAEARKAIGDRRGGGRRAR